MGSFLNSELVLHIVFEHCPISSIMQHMHQTAVQILFSVLTVHCAVVNINILMTHTYQSSVQLK